ncbi:hypothetical protein [Paracraurococcus lichenis]|uniref:Uncharacterized protein n=1 Tax=Paracraurococcus lichenis TaxID=3064888 RepID=A0ABT9DZA7_9PROT|nr:hypothetical protein [Paracraurococcus sp. LOR1-02]MDO9709080.1 hypothetical protein [Paracraurococcus sp. LOR1-02]
MKTIRTAFLAALAALPLLAGAASAHDGWGYGSAGGDDPYWREREARRAWFEAERAREWAWRRHEAWERGRVYAPPPPPAYGPPGGWGPRW